jgi:integrase
MHAWLDDPSIDERPRVVFDGTLRSLIDLYESDPDSAYHDLKENSAVSYADSLKILRTTVGARRLDRVKAIDFRRWYKGWKQPSVEGGEERVRRGYGCIQILRVVLAFGVEAGIADCRRLRRDMEGMRFAKNPPREAIITYDQVEAFVAEALLQGELGLATAQALQFECFLRQGDVIGSWRAAPKNADLQPGEIRVGGRIWRGLTWDRLQLGADLRVRTSKTGQPVVHALDACLLVTRCLMAPNRPKEGPVAARADGQPWGDRRSFGKAWRKVASAAGLPKNIWNLDSRAGAISEAAEAGASDDDIARGAAHATKATTRRIYKRLGHESSVRVNERRVKLRGTKSAPASGNREQQSITDREKSS